MVSCQVQRSLNKFPATQHLYVTPKNAKVDAERDDVEIGVNVRFHVVWSLGGCFSQAWMAHFHM